MSCRYVSTIQDTLIECTVSRFIGNAISFLRLNVVTPVMLISLVVTPVKEFETIDCLNAIWALALNADFVIPVRVDEAVKVTVVRKAVVGTIDGCPDGCLEGWLVGCSVGWPVGSLQNFKALGRAVGCEDGCLDG